MVVAKADGELFEKDTDTISLHLKNIYESGELQEFSTTEESSVVQKEGKRMVRRAIKFYNLDAIISVGYRVNSVRGVQFRQWDTQQLKDYLVKGYAINEKRLAQKQLEVEYLKAGLRIVSRAVEEATNDENRVVFQLFPPFFGRTSHGGCSGTAVDVKIILQGALKANASSLICVHNHPSANLMLSQEDRNITKKIKEGCNVIGMCCLDHLIILSYDYYSMADNGEL